VVKSDIIETKLNKVLQLIASIREQCLLFKSGGPDSIRHLSSQYAISLHQAEIALDRVEYLVKLEVSTEALMRVVSALFDSAAIETIVPSAAVISSRCQLVDAQPMLLPQQAGSGEDFLLPPPIPLARPTSVD
jgi:hypothetical protein